MPWHLRLLMCGIKYAVWAQGVMDWFDGVER